MRGEAYPLQVLLLAFSGWINRHQQDVIEYLVEENRVLKQQMRGRRLRLTDDQRRRLAAKAKRLGRKTLEAAATIVTPDDIARASPTDRAQVDLRLEASRLPWTDEGHRYSNRANGERTRAGATAGSRVS